MDRLPTSNRSAELVVKEKKRKAQLDEGGAYALLGLTLNSFSSTAARGSSPRPELLFDGDNEQPLPDFSSIFLPSDIRGIWARKKKNSSISLVAF